MTTSLRMVLVVSAVINQLAILSATLYVHRHATHRAFELHPIAAWCFRLLLWLTTGINRAEWVALHRKHHAFADREGDPHSPKVFGFWRIQLFNVYYYIRGVQDRTLIDRYARDVQRDVWDRLLFDHVFAGPAIGTIALCAVFGVSAGLLIAGLHVLAFVFFEVPSINGLCHHRGYRTFDNDATNIPLLAWITGGEALHNNHHGHPRRAKLSVLANEFDPGWAVLRVLVLFGLAKLPSDAHTPVPVADTTQPSRSFLRSMLRDERDLPVWRSTLTILAVLLPWAALLFWRFHLALAVPYLALLCFYFGGAYAGLIHEATHRQLFTRRYRWLGTLLIEGMVNPLFGMSPYLYLGQHVGMHHPENNLTNDPSGTLHYQRDSAVDYARYFARFLFLAHWEVLAYLLRAGKRSMFRRAALGLFAHYTLIGFALALEWRAALVVFVLPKVWMRLALSAGNWAQHGFIDPKDPANCYRNTITCIAPGFNKLTFNSGFHAAHHAEPLVHWSTLPEVFERTQGRYREHRAVVFVGIDYGPVFFAMMFGAYDWLAKHHLDYGEERSVLVARLKERLQRIPHPAEKNAPTWFPFLRASRSAVVQR